MATANTLQSFYNNICQNSDRYTFVKTNRYYVSFQWKNGISPFDVVSSQTKTIDNSEISYTPGLPNWLTYDSSMYTDIMFYIKKVELPNIESGEKPIDVGDYFSNNSGGSVDPGLSGLLLSNAMVMQQTNELKFTFRDTTLSFVDNFILPWMYINSANVGILPTGDEYNIKSMPVGKFPAIIRVTGMRNEGIINSGNAIDPHNGGTHLYEFVDCIPTDVSTPNYSDDEVKHIDRDVNFSFSKMYIKNPDSLYDNCDASDGFQLTEEQPAPSMTMRGL